MTSLRPVVETECAEAGLAFEGEEVELVAVGVLAVFADQSSILLIYLRK